MTGSFSILRSGLLVKSTTRKTKAHHKYVGKRISGGKTHYVYPKDAFNLQAALSDISKHKRKSKKAKLEIGKKSYKQILAYMRESQSRHGSVRSALIEYGKMGGFSANKIHRDLMRMGVDEIDALSGLQTAFPSFKDPKRLYIRKAQTGKTKASHKYKSKKTVGGKTVYIYPDDMKAKKKKKVVKKKKPTKKVRALKPSELKESKLARFDYNANLEMSSVLNSSQFETKRILGLGQKKSSPALKAHSNIQRVLKRFKDGGLVGARLAYSELVKMGNKENDYAARVIIQDAAGNLRPILVEFKTGVERR